MVPSGARLVLCLGAAILALAANPSYAADPDARLIVDRERELVDAVQTVLARDGTYSPSLLEPLTALILFYREQDDDALAAVTIERARQVVRVNNGLHTLDQVPFIEQLIRLEEARGNDAAAWDLELSLLRLVRRYPDDLRAVPVLREAGDRTMAVLARYMAGEKPAQLYLGCYYESEHTDEARDCTSGSRKGVMRGMIADAQRNYAEAIAVMLRHELYDSEELRELERELLHGVELLRTPDDDTRPLALGGNRLYEPWRSRAAPLVELASWDLPYFGKESAAIDELRRHETKPQHINDTYHRGRQGLQRLYAYEVASGRSLLSQAEAVVHLADWELLHSNNGYAVEAYSSVRAGLQRAGAEAAAIDGLFLPLTPVVLPAFQPNPLATDAGKEPTGYIDIGFEITRYGRGRSIEILDSANASAAAQERLVHLVAGSRFRPRPTNGAFGDKSSVSLRYYLY